MRRVRFCYDDGSTGNLRSRSSHQWRIDKSSCFSAPDKFRVPSCLTGFKEARGEFLIVLIQISYSTDHIFEIVEPLRRGQADITLASATILQAVENVPFTRAAYRGWVTFTWKRVFSRGRIPLPASFGYRRCLKEVELFSRDKSLHLEILHKAI